MYTPSAEIRNISDAVNRFECHQKGSIVITDTSLFPNQERLLGFSDLKYRNHALITIFDIRVRLVEKSKGVANVI